MKRKINKTIEIKINKRLVYLTNCKVQDRYVDTGHIVILSDLCIREDGARKCIAKCLYDGENINLEPLSEEDSERLSQITDYTAAHLYRKDETGETSDGNFAEILYSGLMRSYQTKNPYYDALFDNSLFLSNGNTEQTRKSALEIMFYRESNNIPVYIPPKKKKPNYSQYRNDTLRDIEECDKITLADGTQISTKRRIVVKEKFPDIKIGDVIKVRDVKNACAVGEVIEIRQNNTGKYIVAKIGFGCEDVVVVKVSGVLNFKEGDKRFEVEKLYLEKSKK